MTDRQIEFMRKQLPHWEKGNPPVFTPEQLRLDEELWCREMINSILCYSGVDGLKENGYWYNEYLKKYEFILGADTVKRLCNEQVEDFKKAIVRQDVHVDYEGVSYNSVIWADDMADEFLKIVRNDLRGLGPETGIGYTLPDGQYHIYAYIDEIDADKVIVLEPNKVVDGACEPFVGDTYIVPCGNEDELRKACDWCFSEFAKDREQAQGKGLVVDEVLTDASKRSETIDHSQDEKTEDYQK